VVAIVRTPATPETPPVGKESSWNGPPATGIPALSAELTTPICGGFGCPVAAKPLPCTPVVAVGVFSRLFNESTASVNGLSASKYRIIPLF
jgi:hypothetical protein